MNAVSFSVFSDAKSPFWLAQLVLSDGKRVKRSTKVPVAGGMFRGEKLTRAQAKNRALMVAQGLANEAAAQAARADNISVRELFDKLLGGKLGRVSTATYKNAKVSYLLFCEWFGKRADDPARLVTRADIKDFVLYRRTLVRHATVKKDITAIRSAFEWALDADIIGRNPCDKVSIPPDSRDEKVVHEAFTLEEITLLLEKLPTEWAVAVRCCLGTYGQRLGDVLNLRWSQFDFSTRTVNIVTGKTARVLCQPMQEWFYNWALQYRQNVGAGQTWLCPNLRLRTSPSHEFTQLVRCHGIGLAGHNTTGRRRVWHSKTFHSLRASVATMLQAAGVSQGLAMELVGHDSAEVHAVYIRPNAEQLRTAAAALPQL